MRALSIQLLSAGLKPLMGLRPSFVGERERECDIGIRRGEPGFERGLGHGSHALVMMS
jgi:hypothetical protein